MQCLSQSQCDRIAIIIIIIGVLLRILNGLVYQSFFMDEIWLGLNIKHKSIIELFSPLDYDQSAPIVFLLVEKIAFLIYPENFALKIPVTIYSLLSLIIFYEVLKRNLKDNLSILSALFIFSFSPIIIWFSICLKQYSLDMLIALIMINIYQSKKELSSRFILLSAILLFVSNITLFVFAGLLIDFVRSTSKPILNKFNRQQYFSLIVFASFALIFFFLFVHGHPSKSFMHTYWKQSFMPIIPNSWSEMMFFPKIIWKLRQTVFMNENYVFSLIYGLSFMFFLYNIKLNVKRKLALIYILIFGVHLIFSALDFYPFALRLIYYLTPLSILIVVADSSFQLKVLRVVLIALVLVALSIDLVLEYPYQPNDVTEIMEFVKSKPESKFYFDSNRPENISIVKFFDEEKQFKGLESFAEVKNQDYILSVFRKDGNEFGTITKLKNDKIVKPCLAIDGYMIYQVIKEY